MFSSPIFENIILIITATLANISKFYENIVIILKRNIGWNGVVVYYKEWKEADLGMIF